MFINEKTFAYYRLSIYVRKEEGEGWWVEYLCKNMDGVYKIINQYKEIDYPAEDMEWEKICIDFDI